MSVNRTAEREEELSRQLSEQQLELASLNEGLEGVALLVGLQSEAEQLLARANQSLDRVRDTSDRVERVRVGTGEVRSALQEIRTNVAEAEEALQEAEGKCEWPTGCVAVCGACYLPPPQFPSSPGSWRPHGGRHRLPYSMPAASWQRTRGSLERSTPSSPT